MAKSWRFHHSWVLRWSRCCCSLFVDAFSVSNLWWSAENCVFTMSFFFSIASRVRLVAPDFNNLDPGTKKDVCLGLFIISAGPGGLNLMIQDHIPRAAL